MNLSRLEDIEDNDKVEIIDKNRAVIRTGDSSTSDSDKKYRINLELKIDDTTLEETLESETKEGLLDKMVAWYTGHTGLEADYL